MKLYSSAPGWAEHMVANARPSISISSGVSRELKPLAYWRELLKLKARAMAHRRATRRWLQLLNSHPAFSEYVRNWPRFLYKIYRPYLSATVPMEARISLLASHYQFVFERGLGPLLMQASATGVRLAAFEGKSGLPYQITLRAVGTCLEREGEMVLQLWQGDTMLYAVAFTFGWRGEGHAVSIGCMQGGKAEGTMDAIRAATRDLHGLRPKQTLVALVRQLGYEFGCGRMLLVSNQNRVVQSAMRKGRVLSDYDQVWEEMGAQRMDDGDFCLPCAPLAELDLESIPSKKRSEARKRHELMMAMAAGVNQRMGIRRQRLALASV
ncbi:VirK/YbjX family protein [Massilia terrae]|uniref:VirK/YbjX family protein n=1 Tax=Massilia terrae TaxID=1811224 RepID=A0ABT2CWL9_9BURK|nr:VirK/YbjX family protein [Massilia terrae]MCS0658379.1 VirK/YbjX family protein [Massilia terrae]